MKEEYKQLLFSSVIFILMCLAIPIISLSFYWSLKIRNALVSIEQGHVLNDELPCVDRKHGMIERWEIVK